MATSGGLFFCRECFEENSADRRGLDCRRHPNASTIEVVWDEEHRCFVRKIRPLPDKVVPGRFIMCRYSQSGSCTKEYCTYAHSQAELREWNRLKDSSKYNYIQV